MYNDNPKYPLTDYALDVIAAVERAYSKAFAWWLDSLERDTWGDEEDDGFDEWPADVGYRPGVDGYLM